MWKLKRELLVMQRHDTDMPRCCKIRPGNSTGDLYFGDDEIVTLSKNSGEV